MLKVGELAKASGVGIPTVRFYEREKILPVARRTAAGYRLFPDESVQIVRFVKKAQALGFSLDDIRELLRLRSSRRTDCRQVQAVAEAKLGVIREKLEQLQRMEAALNGLVRSCRRSRAPLDCPILDALENERAGSQTA